MKAQTEENIVKALADQINRLETLLAEAKLVLQKPTVADEPKLSPIVYRRVRVQLEDGTPDNLNCLTFAFQINYTASTLLVGWSIACNENVDLDRGRVIAAERLHNDPLEVAYNEGRSLVNNVYAHFYNARPSGAMLAGSFNNNVFYALQRRLRGLQSKKSAADQQALEQEIDAFVDALDNR